MTRDLNCFVSFLPGFCIFQDLWSGKVKGIGKEEGGLYLLVAEKGKTSDRGHTSLAVQHLEDAEIWHKRLGHVPMPVIRKISMFKNKNSFVLDHCDVCPLARQTRVPFPISTSRETGVFHLVHIDVWGPYKITTHNGMKYFLTLVDDYSRMTWIFLMQLKSNVVMLLNFFLLWSPLSLVK